MQFKVLDMENWARREHYHYYSNVIKTNYQVDVRLDVTHVRDYCREKGLRFYPVMIYVIMKTVNSHENFRMAVDEEGRLGIWDACCASYTIFHEDDHSFSDIWTPWHEDLETFYKEVTADMAAYKDIKGMQPKAGRPAAFVPVSCVPWLDFVSVSHDTTGPGKMYFPVITFGRFTEHDGRWQLPFSMLVNHAAADGYHTAMFLQDLQKNCDEL